jgi:hypothetical protein
MPYSVRVVEPSVMLLALTMLPGSPSVPAGGHLDRP